ncbi:hypothetical protein C8R44DRAFT_750447 [Mycena epipterygia]|nr:hypothetical protein C8R44DRAFT_750447 [Mycena epipterygia]
MIQNTVERGRDKAAQSVQNSESYEEIGREDQNLPKRVKYPRAVPARSAFETPVSKRASWSTKKKYLKIPGKTLLVEEQIWTQEKDDICDTAGEIAHLTGTMLTVGVGFQRDTPGTEYGGRITGFGRREFGRVQKERGTEGGRLGRGEKGRGGGGREGRFWGQKQSVPRRGGERENEKSSERAMRTAIRTSMDEARHEEAASTLGSSQLNVAKRSRTHRARRRLAPMGGARLRRRVEKRTWADPAHLREGKGSQWQRGAMAASRDHNGDKEKLPESSTGEAGRVVLGGRQAKTEQRGGRQARRRGAETKATRGRQAAAAARTQREGEAQRREDNGGHGERKRGWAAAAMVWMSVGELESGGRHRRSVV